MKELLQQYRGLVLAVLLLALPAYTLTTSGGRRHAPGPVDGAALRSLGALQSQGDGAIGSLSELWESYIDLVDVKEENARLRLDNARLREENTRLQGILQENARLRALVGFRGAHPTLELVAARVVAADVSPFFRVLNLRLDTGGERVEPGMPVVAAEGVVGQVEAVAGDLCTVLLAVDPRSSIDVLTQSNRARGMLRGLGHERSYLAEVAYLLRRDEVEVGDLIVTSGRGGRFPKELLVGRVIAIDRQEYGLYQSIQVEPAVDFSRLEEVYVIVNTPDSAAVPDDAAGP